MMPTERVSPRPPRAASSKRRTTVTVALLLLLGACGSDGAEDDRASPAAYTSRVYGYTVSHPRGWSVVDARRPLAEGEPPATSSGATDILGRDASVRVSTMQLPGVIIAAQPVGNEVELAEWTSVITDTVRFMKDCEQPTRSEQLDIGGEPGTLLTYPDCPSDLGYLHLWAGVVHGARGFHIVWFDDPGHEAADRTAFKRMLASMSFGD
jgi:hypothetical protein